MRERAARALRGNREISCCGIRGRTKDNGNARTCDDAEGTCGIGDDARGKRAEGDLHVARESIDRVYGNTERRGCTALCHRNGIRREGQRKIRNRRRGLRERRSAAAAGPRWRKQQKQQYWDAMTESSHEMTPQTFRAERRRFPYGRVFPGDACAKLRREPSKTILYMLYVSS